MVFLIINKPQALSVYMYTKYPINNWAVGFDNCKVCKTKKYKHQAKGKCTSCYRKEWLKTPVGRKSRLKDKKAKQVRKKYNRFLKSLDGKGKWKNLEKIDGLARVSLNDKIITIPVTKKDMDYWDSFDENKELLKLIKRRYGNRFKTNELRIL